MTSLANLSSAGLAFGMAVILGAALGYGADRLFVSSPFGFLAGFLLGLVAGALNVFRAAGCGVSGIDDCPTTDAQSAQFPNLQSPICNLQCFCVSSKGMLSSPALPWPWQRFWRRLAARGRGSASWGAGPWRGSVTGG